MAIISIGYFFFSLKAMSIIVKVGGLEQINAVFYSCLLFFLYGSGHCCGSGPFFFIDFKQNNIILLPQTKMGDSHMLPITKTDIITDLSRQVIMIYGQPKVGKTTLASMFPNALFAATEQGHKHVSIYKKDLRHGADGWLDFLELGKDLKTEDHSYKTLVIDVVDYLYKSCDAYICKKYGVESPSDLPYGKGFNLVKDEFIRTLYKFQLLGLGIVFISHAKEKEMKTINQSWTYMGTSMSGAPELTVTGMCDIILYCYTNGEGERLMRTKGSKYVLAGDRTAKLPEVMPMDYDQLIEVLDV